MRPQTRHRASSSTLFNFESLDKLQLQPASPSSSNTMFTSISVVIDTFVQKKSPQEEDYNLVKDGLPTAVTKVKSERTSNQDLIKLVKNSISSQTELTAQVRDLYRCIDSEKLECFQSTTNIDPIMSASQLKELDLDALASNIGLRHDMQFDRDLHIRPNHEGSKGQAKKFQADQYWFAVQVEHNLCSLMLDDGYMGGLKHTAAWLVEFRKLQKRIPRLFAALKDILLLLIRDQDVVHTRMDLHLISQQIEKGVFDLRGLTHWLADVLRAHCAPMRDAWIETMRELLVKGAETGSAISVTQGMRELFKILEAMKIVSIYHPEDSMTLLTSSRTLQIFSFVLHDRPCLVRREPLNRIVGYETSLMVK